MIQCSYTRIVVNEKDQILGLIFAEMGKKKTKLKMLHLHAKILLSTLKGEFGNRLTALSFFRLYEKDCHTLYSEADFESEVYLLMVSPLAKGHGLGKSFIKQYLKDCREQGIKKIGLQTATDCDYHFYDHLGFKRESAISTELYDEGKEDENFFIYTKEA
ncbi:MAG: GNAT family N-acetyltransferase [Sphaerochaeta sp.]